MSHRFKEVSEALDCQRVIERLKPRKVNGRESDKFDNGSREKGEEGRGDGDMKERKEVGRK